jgi:hypothetical protein
MPILRTIVQRSAVFNLADDRSGTALLADSYGNDIAVGASLDLAQSTSSYSEIG